MCTAFFSPRARRNDLPNFECSHVQAPTDDEGPNVITIASIVHNSIVYVKNVGGT